MNLEKALEIISDLENNSKEDIINAFTYMIDSNNLHMLNGAYKDMAIMMIDRGFYRFKTETDRIREKNVRESAYKEEYEIVEKSHDDRPQINKTRLFPPLSIRRSF